MIRTHSRHVFALLALALALTMIAHAAPEATSYDIRISLDPDAHTLVGTETVRIRNHGNAPTDEATFALLANLGAQPNPYVHPALLDDQYVAGFDATWTRIHDVRDTSGAALEHRTAPVPPALQTYSLEDGLLIVDLPTPLAPGAEIEIEIGFETKFAHARTLDNAFYRGVYVWRFGWNPVCIAPTGDPMRFEIPAADYRVEITVPEELSVYGGADRQVPLSHAAGLKTFELTSDHPVRSVPLFLGEGLSDVRLEWKGILLISAYLPGHESFARIALTHAAEILEDHAAKYGPFPSKRLVIAGSPGPGLYGMAANGIILYGSDFASQKNMPVLGAYDRLVEYLLAHELAHHWWGIGIGADFNAENWISEGFAEYLSISYFEAKYGAFVPNLFSHIGDGLIEDVFLDAFGFFNLRQHQSEAPYLDLLKLRFDEPIIQPLADSNYVNGLTVRTYSKGYLVLRALADVIGEDTMRQLLVEAHRDWADRILDVEAFQALAEEISGVDLAWFFEDWLYSDAQFDVAIDGFESQVAAETSITTLHATRSGSNLPVRIEAHLEDGSTLDATWNPGSGTAAPTIQSTSPVVSVHLDPLEALPDRNRFNNHWPRKILIDHPFRSEDAEPIGRPLDAYVLTIGPTSLAGSYRNDHQWNLSAMPHIDPDLDFASLDEEELLASLRKTDVVGVLVANINRELTLRAQGMLTGIDFIEGGGTIDLRLTLNTRIFSHPETGNAGQYWYPTYQTDLSFGLVGDLSRPIPYLEASFSQSALFDAYMTSAVRLTAGIPGANTGSFARIDASTRKRFRLAHLLYVDVFAEAATSLLEELPEEFALTLDALHAFVDSPTGTQRALVGLDLVLRPIARDLDYAILNLTRLQRVTPKLFLAGGAVWSDPTADPTLRAEWGGVLMLRLSGFLGIPIDVGFGLALPLLGPSEEIVPFLDLSGSF